MKIPFSPPDIGEREIAEVADAFRSGWITTGPRTKKLESQIAEFCHTNKAVCMNSATSCMEMTLKLFGIGVGDEVIVPAYTYTATASVVAHVGATIVMVDTSPNSFEMDYAKLEEAITQKTKAIIPVDLGGIICDYKKIFEIVERKRVVFQSNNELQGALGRILVLSDAAHAFGASRQDKMCGEIADFTSFSFHAVKNFTTAEGGAITWKNIDGVDNEWIYKQYQLLSLHGQSKDALAKTQLGAWEYDIVAPNYKCNMTDIMAAIGLVQFKRYPAMLVRRRQIIDRYCEVLRDCDVTLMNHYSEEHSSSGHLFLVRLNDKDEAFRNSVIIEMAKRGIATNVHYKPLPMMTAYQNMDFDIKDYPNAFNQYRNEITLPLHTCLTDEEIEYIMENFIHIISE